MCSSVINTKIQVEPEYAQFISVFVDKRCSDFVIKDVKYSLISGRDVKLERMFL
jgi:hypothetical protein